MMPNDNISNDTDQLTDFNFKKNPKTIIKVIGVGGGGGNAVSHMYREGIHNVSFVLCNTDCQALDDSPVPVKVQLGREGLGAGNRPAKAKEAAEESLDSIRNILQDGTRMVFITAGMGGGTGTGAAPVIAQIAKDMGILTVGIVTIPFKFEGKMKIRQALSGVDEISKHVDALLVINNQRLMDIYRDMSVPKAFEKADETLSVAAKSIAEIITVHGQINLDFNDVTTVLKDGGVAIMSIGYGEGEGRIKHAIKEALHSPLLNNNDVYNAKKILLNISYNDADEQNTLQMDEMQEVDDFMSNFKLDFESKWGLTVDQNLNKKIKVTILASGFGLKTLHDPSSVGAVQEVTPPDPDFDDEIQRYYGNGKSKPYPNRYGNLFIFPQEDLGNKDVISLVEMTPTFKRSKEQLNDIKKMSLSAVAGEVSSDNGNAPSGKSGTVISFN